VPTNGLAFQQMANLFPALSPCVDGLQHGDAEEHEHDHCDAQGGVVAGAICGFEGVQSSEQGDPADDAVEQRQAELRVELLAQSLWRSRAQSSS
jgi:hypothetical protein